MKWMLLIATVSTAPVADFETKEACVQAGKNIEAWEFRVVSGINSRSQDWIAVPVSFLCYPESDDRAPR